MLLVSVLAASTLWLVWVWYILRDGSFERLSRYASWVITSLLAIVTLPFARSWRSRCTACSERVSPPPPPPPPPLPLPPLPSVQGGICWKCGYDVRHANVGSLCPECATPIKKPEEADKARRTRQVFHLLVIHGVAIPVGIILVAVLAPSSWHRYFIGATVLYLFFLHLVIHRKLVRPRE